MSNGVKDGSSASAIEQVTGLLRPSVRSRVQMKEGHIDLLGERDPTGPSLMQRAMSSKIVPRIYEFIWRPLASRVFFGLFGPTPAREYRMALEMLDISPGDQVLDVGCGPGNFTRRFARAASGGLVVGFDASETMLAAAARRSSMPNLAYVRGDAGILPFEDTDFDAVCCFGTLHLLEDPLKTLGEIDRVLSPGGRLGLLATWSRREPPPRKLSGLRVFGRDELTDWLTGRGFVDVNQRVAGWGQFVSARKPKG